MNDMSRDFPAPLADFGGRLRQARLQQSLSQAGLALQLDIGRSTLVEYESGRILPSLPVAVRLAVALSVSLDWLCGLSPGAPGSANPPGSG